jgi:hypothetical protein
MSTHNRMVCDLYINVRTQCCDILYNRSTSKAVLSYGTMERLAAHVIVQ